jgi:hypothetical protein
MWGELGTKFAKEWYPILSTHNLDMEWPEEYKRRGGKERRGAVVVQEVFEEDLEDMEDFFE